MTKAMGKDVDPFLLLGAPGGMNVNSACIGNNGPGIVGTQPRLPSVDNVAEK